MSKRTLVRVAGWVAALVCFSAQADVFVPTGGAFALNGGTLDLGSTDLKVDGSMSLAAGAVTGARNVTIDAGGTLDGGSGAITLFGNWSDSGTFSAGSGSVNFVDGATASSTVSGNTTFHNLAFVSSSGKTYAFAAGSTQTIGGLLTILGSAARGIQFTSTTPGAAAFIDLLPAGSQNIAFVGVSNVHATGQHLAANQTNDGGSGDASGWFGAAGGGAAVVDTPALSLLGSLLLLLSLLAAALRARRFPSH